MAEISGTMTMWIFNGVQSNFPSGVFSRRDLAEDWIKKHRLTGTLTQYPVDVGAYDWAIARELFTPSKDHESTALFIGKFSSASQEHYHYEDGTVA